LVRQLVQLTHWAERSVAHIEASLHQIAQLEQSHA
jgi:hypothetical protein